MKNNKGKKLSVSTKIVGIFILALTIMGILLFFPGLFRGKSDLPVLGEPGHVAGNFSFLNQDGAIVTEKTVQDKITVVEYFFTSCPSICPVMNKNLKTVYDKHKQDSRFMILSHTVDPERDSVPVMKKYADKFGARTPAWQFLTGNKDSLYARARYDYLLAAVDSGASNFIHTQYITLLDSQRRIRGFYDATSSAGIAKLDDDIDQLLRENAN